MQNQNEILTAALLRSDTVQAVFAADNPVHAAEGAKAFREELGKVFQGDLVAPEPGIMDTEPGQKTSQGPLSEAISKEQALEPGLSKEQELSAKLLLDNVSNNILNSSVVGPSEDVREAARALLDLKAYTNLSGALEAAVVHSENYVHLSGQSRDAQGTPDQQKGESVALAAKYLVTMERNQNTLPSPPEFASEGVREASSNLKNLESVAAGGWLAKTYLAVAESEAYYWQKGPTSGDMRAARIAQTLEKVLKAAPDDNERVAAVQGAVADLLQGVKTAKGGASEDLPQKFDSVKALAADAVLKQADKVATDYAYNPDIERLSGRMAQEANAVFSRYADATTRMSDKSELGEFAAALKVGNFLSSSEAKNILGDTQNARNLMGYEAESVRALARPESSNMSHYPVNFEPVFANQDKALLTPLLAKARDAGINQETISSAMAEWQSFAEKTGQDPKAASQVDIIQALLVREALLDSSPELGRQFQKDTTRELVKEDAQQSQVTGLQNGAAKTNESAVSEQNKPEPAQMQRQREMSMSNER